MSKSILDKIAHMVDSKSKHDLNKGLAKSAQPDADPDEAQAAAKPGESCPMCGSMVKGEDPSKASQFMNNNPFKK